MGLGNMIEHFDEITRAFIDVLRLVTRSGETRVCLALDIDWFLDIRGYLANAAVSPSDVYGIDTFHVRFDVFLYILAKLGTFIGSCHDAATRAILYKK